MTCLLVVAKAPVPGLAKTRLIPATSPEVAADIAAASLVDTLVAVLATRGTRAVVAMTGDLDAARRRDELLPLLDRCVVIPQRGEGFPARLAAAHADVATLLPDTPVVQIGMDTPQVTPALLIAAARALRDHDAALGPATDGGWWALALRDPRFASALEHVPTSRDDTGDRTTAALRAEGLSVGTLPVLSDVDTIEDAVTVAALVPHGRFAEAVERAVPAGARR